MTPEETQALSRAVAEARDTDEAWLPGGCPCGGCAGAVRRGEPKPYAERPDLILPVLRDLCREQDVTVTIVLAKDGATGVLWQGGPTPLGFKRGEVAEAACEAYLALKGVGR